MLFLRVCNIEVGFNGLKTVTIYFTDNTNGGLLLLFIVLLRPLHCALVKCLQGRGVTTLRVAAGKQAHDT